MRWSEAEPSFMILAGIAAVAGTLGASASKLTNNRLVAMTIAGLVSGFVAIFGGLLLGFDVTEFPKLAAC